MAVREERVWEMQDRVARFDAERFRSLGPGFVSLSLVAEAGEVADVVKKRWRLDTRMGQPEGYQAIPPDDREAIGGELADVILLSLVLANHLELDVEEHLERKLSIIEERLKGGYYGSEAQPTT